MGRKTLALVIALIASVLVPVGSASADLSPDGDPSAWVTNDRVFAITQVGDRVYAGGRFTQVAPRKSASYVDRSFLAAFDADSGEFIASFTPELDGEVRTLASSADGSALYVGGAFSTVNGTSQPAIVSLDPITGATTTSFDVTAAVGSTVYDIEVDGDTVYLGGSFNNLNGVVNASRAARVDTFGTVDTTWRPRPNAVVEAISLPPAGDRVYLGGRFTAIAGVDADNLAAVRTDNAALIEDYEADSDSNCDSPDRPPGGIRSMDSTNDRIVALPYNNNCVFVFQPGQRNRVHQYDMDGDVQGVTLVGNRFYVGGHSAVVDSFDQNRLYAFNLDGTFDPTMTTEAGGQPGIFALYGSGPYLWIGGTIFRIGAETSIKDLGRVGPAAGETLPTTPTSLAVSTGAGAATLTWNASSDADGIIGYRVMRGYDQLAFVGGGTTTYSDTRYRDAERNLYHVQAVDGRRNLSELSNGVLAGIDGIVVGPVANRVSALADTVDFVVPAIGGNGTVTFSSTGLPPGLSISSTGRVTGAPTTAGNFTVQVEATDGVVTGSDIFEWAVVNDSIPVGPTALVEFSSPLPGQVVEGADLLLSGVASDDSGIDRVRISVLNVTTGQYLQSDGNFGAGFNRVEAGLVARGSTVSAFELAAGGLAPGNYRVNALPIGDDGDDGTRAEMEFVVVAALGADPVASVTFPLSRENVYGAFTIIGTATDDIGVADVQILVKEKFPSDAGRRLQADYTLDAAYHTFDAAMTNPDAPVTQFWLSLPAGLPSVNPWQIRVIVTDTDGNRYSDTAINGFGIDDEYYDGRNAATPYPEPPNNGGGAQPPVVVITTPATTIAPSTPVVISGSASDNIAVDAIAVQLRNSVGWYLQPGGGFASAEADLPADLTGIGSTNATYSSAIGTLPIGSYTVEVEATDGSGLSSSAARTLTVTSGPAPSTDIVIGAGLIGNEFNISAGSDLAATRNLLLSSANFGPAGVVAIDSLSITEDVADLTSGYLDGIDILFNGWVPDGEWSSAELDLVEDWVDDGGVLVASNDSPTFDALAVRFGNPIVAQGDGTWSSVAPSHPIVDGPFGSWATVQGATSVFSYFGEVPGWTVIARNASDQPTIVTREVGAGYVILTGDEGIFRANFGGSNADMVGNMFADAISYVVGEPAAVPTIDAIAAQSSTVGDAVSVAVVASAPGGGAPTLSATGLPPGVSLDAGAAVLSGVPTSAGTYDVTVFASAGGATVSTVFIWTVADRPDFVLPDTTLTSPSAGDDVPVGVVTLTGQATDEGSGVARVRIAVRDRDTTLWLQPDGTFAAGFATIDAALDAPGELSTGFTLDLDLPVGRYAVTPRAVDDAGNAETDYPRVLFDVVPPDTVEPDSLLVSPAEGDVVDPGPRTLVGLATDDVTGISRVQLSVRDRDSLLWLQPDGTFAAGYALLDASVDSPGEVSTSWSLDVDLPSARYAVVPRATDVAGNEQTTMTRALFEVMDPLADLVEPDTSITTPVGGDALPVGVIGIAGQATDDASGVTAVRISIRDRDSLLWLQPDGTFATGFALVDAALDAPGAASTGWSLDVTLPAGRYALGSRATDGSGNVETDRPFVPFTLN